MVEKKNFNLYRKQKNLNLETEIKRRPWENYSEGNNRIYQCYCNELKRLKEEKKDPITLNRTSLSDGKPLRYQNGLEIDFYKKKYSESNDKNDLERQFLKSFQLIDKTLTGQFLKTFQILYKSPLSLAARSVLLSFNNKYIYYAIDDILYLLDSNPKEREQLLGILHYSMLSLHNDYSINFFDIWIDSIYLNTNSKPNRLLQNQVSSSQEISETMITLKLHYFTRTPIKKPESIW